jgi:hypothetical protein
LEIAVTGNKNNGKEEEGGLIIQQAAGRLAFVGRICVIHTRVVI